MNRAAVPARLLWVIDREALERNAVTYALRGGVRWLHLRDSEIEARTWLRHLKDWGRVRRDVRAVVNAGPRWAQEGGLGAHLKAVQPGLGRAERDAWSLLGRSVHDSKETRAALNERPDYLVAGPIFPTTSKPGHAGIGLDGLARILEAAGGCPVLAIGGIDAGRIAELIAAGAYGVAVRSGITASGDPRAASAAYLRALPIDPD